MKLKTEIEDPEPGRDGWIPALSSRRTLRNLNTKSHDFGTDLQSKERPLCPETRDYHGKRVVFEEALELSRLKMD